MDTKLNINAIEELSIPVTKLKDPENLTTGFANDLTGRNEATAEEFTLRPSAGNISIRDDSATIKRIKGNSIVWNQLSRFRDTWTEKGLTATNNGNEIHISGTVTEAFNYDIVQLAAYATLKRDGRKYLVSLEAPTGVTYGIQGYNLNNSSPFIWSQNDGTPWGGAIAISVPLGTTIDYTFKNPIIIDLTQMFGAGNEPDTVEEFKALFPDNYYEYNPGQLVSMTANGLFTNGFNQWDGKVEVGYIHDATGDVKGNQDYLCTDFIRVIPNQKYYINTEQTTGRWGAWYDVNKEHIAGIIGYDQILTAPSNAAYVRLTIKTVDSGNPDTFCLNLSHTGVENGKYEPYWDATKDLSVIQKYFPNGMRSAGSIYDEISFDETTQKWVAIQRVGNVDLGSLSWSYSEHLFSGETVAGFKTSIEDIIFANTATTLPNITVSKYNINTADKVANGYAATETFTGYKAYKTDLSAYFTFTTDASEFKASLSGVMLNYELAEPIITVIEEPINLSYKVGDFGIEQILSDSFSAPFKADIIYQFNATDRIRENSLNIEKLSKTQKDYLPLSGGTMSGQLNSQDIKPVEDNTYQLGDSTHKYKNVFSDFFTGNLEGNAKTATVATDLSGRVEATPEVFTYHPSAGEKSIKDNNAFIRRIKGNSVVWNQLSQVFPNDNTRSAHGVSAKTVSGTHYIECSGTTTAIEGNNYIYVDSDIYPKVNGVSGHKYLFLVEGCENLQINLYKFVSPSKQITNGGTIVTCTKNELIRYSVSIPTYTPVGTTINEKIRVLYIDLTQMFGVGNEPTTVEEFRALYPDSYYPYNAGELRNLDCSGIKTVGFNQWDEQWEVGYLNADGTTAGYVQNYIRAKNYIPVISGEKYYAKLPNGVSDAQLYAVDENYNLIKQIYSWVNNQFFIPDGAAYIRFYLKYGSEIYNNDICINLSHTGYRDGEYEPYKEVTHSLPLSQITNGEPLRYVYNSYAGEQYDEINETEYIKRIGVVDLGTLDWAWDEANSVFKTYGLVGNGNAYRFFCSKYTATNYGFADMADKTIRSTRENPTILGIKDSSFGTDASALKASLAGVLLNYELAEPIVTPIETPIDFNYYVEDFGTEEALLAEDSAPFNADIVYQFNATDRIRENSLNIEKLSKTQNEYLLLAGGTMSGQVISQDIKPVEDSTYQLGDSTHKYDNVFSNFFTGNLEGNAKTATDLTGRIEATPEVFTYHPSAGEKSIKDNNAFIRRVKGNSVVWNQLVDNNTLFIGERNGMVISKNEDGSITFNGTASADIFYNLVNLSIPIGHKVALTGVDNMSPFTFFLNGGIGNTLNSSGILTCSHIGTNGNGWMFLYITANTTFNNVTINPKIHYLTQMFGIGNEPNSIEEFRALYPDSYYTHNPGELRNLVCSGIKTVGFNQWDEQWEVGQISSSNGNVVSGENKIISKNYIPVLPNTSYFLTLPLPQDDSHGVYYYDGNKNYIGYLWIAKDVNQKLFTTPSNCLFIKFDSWGTTYNNDICINLHHTGYRDGEYEPYKEVTHSLPLSQITNGEPLRKAGSVYDEINETHYIKRVGVIDLGNLNWWLSDSNKSLFAVDFFHIWQDNSKAANILCAKYVTLDYASVYMESTGIAINFYAGNYYLAICDKSFTDAASLKASLSGVLLHYELAEPIVTPIETPIDFNYYVEDFGTEEALLQEDSAPFSADIVYQFNATDTIRVLEKNIKQLLNKITSLENIIANAITNSNNL